MIILNIINNLISIKVFMPNKKEILLDEISPKNCKTYLIILLALAIFLCIYFKINDITSPKKFEDFEIFKNLFLSGILNFSLSLFIFCIIILFLTAFLHEFFHCITIPMFWKNVSISVKFPFTPSVACKIKLTKTQYIIAALAPLVAVNIISLIVWFNSNLIFQAIAFWIACANTIGSLNDVMAAKYVLRSSAKYFKENHTYLEEYF